jgi:hypothetical protein
MSRLSDTEKLHREGAFNVRLDDPSNYKTWLRSDTVTNWALCLPLTSEVDRQDIETVRGLNVKGFCYVRSFSIRITILKGTLNRRFAFYFQEESPNSEVKTLYQAIVGYIHVEESYTRSFDHLTTKLPRDVGTKLLEKKLHLVVIFTAPDCENKSDKMPAFPEGSNIYFEYFLGYRQFK